MLSSSFLLTEENFDPSYYERPETNLWVTWPVPDEDFRFSEVEELRQVPEHNIWVTWPPLAL